MARFTRSFGLDSLMLVIALIGACFAVMRTTLTLGVPLSILSASALVRTVFRIARAPAGERRASAFDKVILFFVSMAIAIVVGTPAVVSFMLSGAVCLGCEVDPTVSLVVGIITAAGAGYSSHRLVSNAFRG